MPTTLTALNGSTPKYLVSDCGSKTIQVHHALTLALASLTAAITEARNLGTRSTHGFTALFKQQSSAPFVASYLHDMQKLKPLAGRWPNPLIPTVPEFVCVQHDTILRYKHLNFDPYMACKQPKRYGMVSRRARYIFLCDFFFEQPATPTAPAAETCIRVQNNEFQGFGNLLCLYQKYMLVHEMMHFYLGTQGLGFRTDPMEVYGLNEAVDFDASLSLRNPQNYQAFVASKSRSGFLDLHRDMMKFLRESQWLTFL